MILEYPTNNPDLRHLHVAGTAGAITYQDVEGIHTRAAVIGSSLRGEVGLDVILALKKNNVLLGADMQGFVRVLHGQDLVFESWNEMETTLPHLDILMSDSVEVEFLTGETAIYKAAQLFSKTGPKEVVLTHRDGVLVYSNGEFHHARFYPLNLSDRSGRGDTCIGAYMAMRLTKNPSQASIWAAAVTSLKMERLGPFDRPMEDVLALMGDKYASA